MLFQVPFVYVVLLTNISRASVFFEQQNLRWWLFAKGVLRILYPEQGSQLPRTQDGSALNEIELKSDRCLFHFMRVANTIFNEYMSASQSY